MFLGAGLAGLDDGRGVEHGSPVTEQHLFNLLGMCADRSPASYAAASPTAPTCPGKAGGPAGGRHSGGSLPRREVRGNDGIEAEERAKSGRFHAPVAGFDLTFSPSKSVSVAWALADRDTKAQISRCHRRAVE